MRSAAKSPTSTALYSLLDEIRTRGNVVAVRGDLDQAYYAAKEHDPNYKIARRKNDKGDGIPAHLLEVQRRWIMHDLDDYPLPPDADLAIDPVGIIDAAIRNVLPEEFHDAKCIWQLSNSAGLVPGILKAHLFFWTDEPWDNAKLRKWIKLNAPHLDTAPFSANQPHFVCDPIIKDLDGRTAIDPLPARLGWRSGHARGSGLAAAGRDAEGHAQGREAATTSDERHAGAVRRVD